MRLNVRYWHLTDICVCNAHVCFWGVKQTFRRHEFMSAFDAVDGAAAGVKTIAVGNHFYNAASTSAIRVPLPISMRNFPNELLPQ
jgi:hypothetical protein